VRRPLSFYPLNLLRVDQVVKIVSSLPRIICDLHSHARLAERSATSSLSRFAGDTIARSIALVTHSLRLMSTNSRQCRSPRKRQSCADLAFVADPSHAARRRHQLTFLSPIDHDRQISFSRQLICVLLNPNSASLAAGGEKIRVGRRNSFP